MPILSGTDPNQLARSAQALADGVLVAFPTETVYGLGARADDDAAVGRIFAAKGRPADHPLIVHVASLNEGSAFGDLSSAAAQQLAARHWPGPLTLIVPRRPGVATAAAGGHHSIGLRVPAHPVALALLQAALERGVPGVAGPSANRFGRVSPTRADHVADEFGDDLIVLDGGACPVGIESAIVDCTRGRPSLLRPGQIDRMQIEATLGLSLRASGADAPRASGTLESHYAPKARVRLMDGPSLQAALDAVAGGRAPEGLAVYSRSIPQGPQGIDFRPMPQRPAEVAHELFAVLRAFDHRGARVIWIEAVPPGADWDGVRDRLGRAASP